MTSPRIKICGVTEPAALEAAIAARIDYVGFNFVPGSPRLMPAGWIAALGDQAQGRIVKVGLFLDANEGTISEAIAAASLDAIQLHGAETPAQVAQLRTQTGLPVWKAISVSSRTDLDRAQAFVGAADLVLLDAKTPKGALPGGQGLRFDWTLLQGWKPPLPWGLAGGLDPANVADAIRLTGAPLVDTASGVESAPGVKDPVRIRQFCDAVRAV